jgi:hypothetical protein
MPGDALGKSRSLAGNVLLTFPVQLYKNVAML